MSIQIIFDAADDLFGLLGRSDAVVASLRRLEVAMATQKENLDKLTADFAAAVQRNNDALATLNTQVATLQQQNQTLQAAIDSGDVSPDIQAAVDALDASINALDVPPPVTPPTPTPAPDQPPAPTPTS